MIYAAEIQAGKWIKIGFSDDCAARLLQLQTGSPYRIGLLFIVEGSLMQEQAIHAALRTAFARIRLRQPGNEWYTGRHPFMKQFLADLRFGATNGLLHAEKYNPSIKQPGKDKIHPSLRGGFQPICRMRRGGSVATQTTPPGGASDQKAFGLRATGTLHLG